MFRSMLATLWCLFLVLCQVFFFFFPVSLGPAWTAATPFMFFGFNAPTMLIASGLPRPTSISQVGGPVLIVLMGAVLVNFIMAGNRMDTLGGQIHMFTAQALWLAVPVCFMARRSPF